MVSANETVTVQSSAINGMSWPGRVHVQREVLTVPQVNVSEGLRPLVAPNAQRIVFTASPENFSQVIGLRSRHRFIIVDWLG